MNDRQDERRSLLDMTLDEIMPDPPKLTPCCGVSYKRSGLGLVCSNCNEWFAVELVR